MSRAYSIIETIKESERVSVYLAAADGIEGPVIVKRIGNADPAVFCALRDCDNEHIPRIYDIIEEEPLSQGCETPLCEPEGDGADDLTQRRHGMTIIEEYVDGETLAVRLAEGSYSLKERVDLMIQLCDALECIHSLTPPLIHRDIKPSNIIITGKGVVKLVDFDASRRYKKDDRTTNDTTLLGTEGYAAPEQFGFKQTNAQSDIYSFGVLMSDVFEIGGDEKREALTSFDRRRLEKIIARCTRFDPNQRYEKTADVKKDLQGVICGKTRTLIRTAIIAAAAIAAVIAVVLISGATRRGDAKPAQDYTEAQDTSGENNSEELNSETKKDEAPEIGFTKVTFTGGETPEDVEWTYKGYTTIDELLAPGQSAPDYLTEDYVKKLATMENVLLNNYRFVIHFYPLLEPKNDLCYRNAHVDDEGVELAGITITDLMNEKDYVLDSSEWYFEDHIVHIRRSALEGLAEGYYEIKTDMDTGDGYIRDLLTLNVNALETDPQKMIVCPFDCLCIDRSKVRSTSFPVPHNIDRRIVSLKHDADGTDVDEAHFAISGDGKVLSIYAEEFADPNTEAFCYDVIYDDGSSHEVTVYVF